jgi:hypothetical protein
MHSLVGARERKSLLFFSWQRVAALRPLGALLARSAYRHAVNRVYDAAGNVIKTHEHAGEFKEW